MRRTDNSSLDQVVHDAVTPIVERVSSAIAKHVAKLVGDQLDRELRRRNARPRTAGTAPRSRSRKLEITTWIADKRARRVPNFVIEMTGLDTKKKIVARYGEDAAFEKGKPLPTEVRTPEPKAVKAKPPTIRKGGKAAA